MGLWGRFRRAKNRDDRVRMTQPGGGGPTVRASTSEDIAHLEDFLATRRGVEGFTEPRTTVSPPTLLLVAHDGEWTRRRVQSEEWARTFTGRHKIPCYDAGIVGIPGRMRDYIQRQKQERRL